MKNYKFNISGVLLIAGILYESGSAIVVADEDEAKAIQKVTGAKYSKSDAEPTKRTVRGAKKEAKKEAKDDAPKPGSVDELKAQCVAAGIEFPAKATKATLLGLLADKSDDETVPDETADSGLFN